MSTSTNFKLSFTTWLCPEWTAAAIIDAMTQYGYHGVELCGGEEHLHGVELTTSDEELMNIRRMFDEAGLGISCIATPCAFSSSDGEDREEQIAECKQYLELASKIGAPYVRVYGGPLPEGFEVTGVIDYVADALGECATYCEEKKLRTMLVLPTHDAFSHTKYVREILKQVYSDKLGVLWDVLSPYRVLESIEEAYDNISEWIKHVHVQDYIWSDDRLALLGCEPGQGFVPYEKALEYLRQDSYRGYLSVAVIQEEPDPDRVLPTYLNWLQKLARATEPQER